MARAVGKVWDSCDEVQRIPFDDKTALGRSLARIGKGLRDVQREVGEMAPGPAAEDAAPLPEGEEEEEDGMLVMEGDAFDEADMEVVAALKEVVEEVGALLKLLMRSLLLGAPLDQPGAVEDSERCVDECAVLQRALENTVACSYPPVDPQEVGDCRCGGFCMDLSLHLSMSFACSCRPRRTSCSRAYGDWPA